MSVGISLERKALQVTWEPGDYDGEVQLFFTNPGNLEDVSNTDARANDGDALVSVPYNFSGEINCEVKALDGTVVDSGVLSV